MSRENEHRPRNKPMRKTTPDGLEERSENIGDTSREGFNLRAERDAPLGRNRDAPPNAPASVHETIARHRSQARKFNEHAAAPDDIRSADTSPGDAMPPQDVVNTGASAAAEHTFPLEDGSGAQYKPVHSHRAAEQRRDALRETETAQPHTERLHQPAADDGRLSHDSSYRQRFGEEQPGRLKTDNARLSDAPADRTASDKPKRGSAYQHKRFEEFRVDKPDAPQSTDHPVTELLRETEQAEQTIDQPREPLPDDAAPEKPAALTHEQAPRSVPDRPGRLIHDRAPEAPKDAPHKKPPSPDAVKYIPPDTDKSDADITDSIESSDTADAPPATEPAVETTQKPARDSGTGSGTERSRQKKEGKLRFSEDETAPGNKSGRKLEKAQHKAERSGQKLDKARDHLPKKRRPAIQRTYDEKSQKPKNKLVFEETVKSQRAHMRGPLVTRPIKAGGRNITRFAHSKVFQVEHENDGVKAAHRAEMLAESGLRTAYRLHKTSPYRKAAKLEARTTKLNMKASYQKALHDNPKLKSNILSRMAQKKKIQRQYAKTAREAKKAGQRAKKTGDVLAKVGQAIVRTIAKHPVVFAVIGALLLLIVMFSSLFSTFSSMGSGVGGVVAVAVYPSQDADMLAAEAQYAGMEADLQYRLDNYAALNPGYDNYVFDLDEIGHDPYVLISILSAFHDGPWTVDGVQDWLTFLFERQYILTETVTAETRTRTETGTLTDPVTGVETEYDYDVDYDYYTVTVTLENFNLSHLPIHIMGEAQLSRYAVYTGTLGGRPDLFPIYLYPRASTYLTYETYDIPKEYLDADPIFAAMIAEANKYLGFPYIWGGYSPNTSFDCSGYVSWILNHSGWNIGRLGAQGLYNISAPVSAADARPGDLVFFHSTYDAPGVTHVGVYAGDGMMVHAGNPIGYVSINTAYWQSHFYAFGRP